MHRWIFCTIAVLLALAGPTAHAQSCTVSAGALSSSSPYDPFGTFDNATQGGFSFSCTRPPGSGTPSFPATFWVGVDNGLNFSGTRRVRNGSSYIGHALYQTYGSSTSCSTAWGGTSGFTFANSETEPGKQTAGPFSATYCFLLIAGSNTATPGTHNDTVTISVRSTNSSGFLWGQTNVTLSTLVNAACSLSAPPALVIPYTSFSASAVAVTGADYQMRCTNTTSWAISLDALSGTILGLNYTLELLGTVSGSGDGNFSPTKQIRGTVGANQSGVCANPAGCSASQTRVLTITY